MKNNQAAANARPSTDASARPSAKETAWNLRHDIRELTDAPLNAKAMRSNDANWGAVGSLGTLESDVEPTPAPTHTSVHAASTSINFPNSCVDLDGFAYFTAEAASCGNWDMGDEEWDADDFAELADTANAAAEVQA